MKKIVLVLTVLFCTNSFAKSVELDLVDNCGTLRKVSEEASSLTMKDGTVYTVISGEETGIDKIQQFPDGTRQCIRAYVNQVEPQILMLFDYWDYVIREYVIDCKVSKIIDDNVFEEGLSVDEYPEVYLQRVIESDDKDSPLGLELRIGAMQSYEEADGDVIKTEITPREVKVLAQYKDETGKVEIVMKKDYTKVRTKKGIKKYRKAELSVDGDLVAKLKCD